MLFLGKSVQDIADFVHVSIPIPTVFTEPLNQIEVPHYQTPESSTEHFPSSSGKDENDSQNQNDGTNEYLVRSGSLGMCDDPYCLTCPIYLRSSEQRIANALGTFNQKENMCNVRDEPMTIHFVEQIRTLACIMYFLNIFLQFRVAYVSYESWPRGAHLIDHPKKIAFRVLPIGLFTGMTAQKKIIKNLLIFLPSGHVVGSIWYIFGVQRVHGCLLDVCRKITSNITGCLAFTDCRHQGGAPGLWKNNEIATACLSSTSDTIRYGIFQDAASLATDTSVLKKIAFSLFWGFKKYLQALQSRYLIDRHLWRTEMELRDRDVDQWMNHRSLPRGLRRRIRMAEHYNWAATRGFNEEKLMENWPEELQTDIRRHLFKFMKKIQIFALMDESILDVICERLKPRRYIIGSRILSEGGVVETMVFVMRGKLESIAADGTRLLLLDGDACGEELLPWYLEHATVRTDGKKVRLPTQRLVSKRSVWCLTNVEAFSLRLADLENLSILFRGFLQNPRMNYLIGDYMQQNGFRLHGETGREDALFIGIVLTFQIERKW
ncbi:unnamed protein product [Sphenostylis stenocarpa]|uniref:Cyclic nucleotide-binding domain-containing protein n=1 Tax=Sphenostylis stenocarpa TaxID=92480 RepID=A0AA86T653_9FABA|nr:unnamed protein product [Sphenostylis stenocarpa]